jgi:hypothetical protein
MELLIVQHCLQYLIVGRSGIVDLYQLKAVDARAKQPGEADETDHESYSFSHRNCTLEVEREGKKDSW